VKIYKQIEKFIILNRIYLINIFFIFLVFLYIPVNLLWENRGDLNNNLFLILPSLIIFVLFIFLVSKKKVNNFFLFISFYIILKQSFIDLPIEKLSGLNDEKTNLFNQSFFSEFIILVFLILIFKYKKILIYNFTLFLMGILFVFSFLQISIILKNNFVALNLNKISKNNLSNIKNNNIYLITFDALSSFHLEKFFSNTQNQKDFNNFIFFENNHSNYTNTALSVPSFLSGLYLEEEEKVKEFRQKYKKGFFFEALKSNNYKISQYTQATTMLSPLADDHVSAVDLLKRKYFKKYFLDFYDLIILNLIPSFSVDYYFKNNIGFLSKKFGGSQSQISLEDQRAIGSSLLIKKLIKDEDKRGKYNNFVHAHVYLPHGPYVLNQNGNYISRADKKFHSQTNAQKYSLQADYVIREIINFVNSLKKNNNFKNSLIIINSDTGSWSIGSKRKFKSQNLSDNLRFYSTNKILNQVRSALLIKFPYNNEEFKVRSDLSSLLDIVPTVMHFVDQEFVKKVKKIKGMNLYKSKRSRKNNILFFLGYKQRSSPNSKWEYIDKMKGLKKLNSFSFSINDGYKKLNDIIVK